MDDVEELAKFIAKKLEILEFRFIDFRMPVDQRWERMTMKEVWQKYANVNLDEYLKIERLKDLVCERGYTVSVDDAYEDLFFKIFLNEIEPKLGMERPVFVYDYPAQMASLSRLCAHDPRYAERMECYIGGLELCNAFGELTDGNEQKVRLEADRELRQKLGKPVWPVDGEFIQALKALPADLSAEDLSKVEAPGGAKVGGIALGIDRMVVLFTGAKDINEVIFQSMADQHQP